MSRLFRSNLRRSVFCALLGLALAAGAAAAAPVSPAEQDVLARHRADRARGLRTGDAALLAVPTSEAFRLMTEGVPTVFGAADAAAYYRAFLARFTVQDYERRDIEVRLLGTRVVEFGRFVEKLTLKSDGRTFELNGKYLEAWEKAPDGGLRLVVAAWNYDARLPDGEAWRFSEVPAVRTALLGRAQVDTDLSLELEAWSRWLETAIVQHDGGRWSRSYADDAVLLANNESLHAGRRAIDAYVANHARELPVFEKLDLRNDRIEDVGDGYVFEYASHVAAWRSGDASGVSTGKNLRIWRREPNHLLKIVVQIGAYD